MKLSCLAVFPPGSEATGKTEGDEPPMTACGGNLIGGEISRNKQCPLCGLAPIEAAESRKGEGFPLACYHSAIAEW